MSIIIIVLAAISLVSSLACAALVVRHALPARAKERFESRCSEGIALANAAKELSPELTSQDKMRIAMSHIKATKAKVPGDADIRKTVEILLRKP